MSTAAVKHKVRVRVGLPIIIYWDVDDKCYYAESPHFYLVRHGSTPEKAIECFMDAFDILANYKIERGALGEYLGEAGYSEEHIWGDADELILFHPPGLTYPLPREGTDMPESTLAEIHMLTFPEREPEECLAT